MANNISTAVHYFTDYQKLVLPAPIADRVVEEQHHRAPGGPSTGIDPDLLMNPNEVREREERTTYQRNIDKIGFLRRCFAHITEDEIQELMLMLTNFFMERLRFHPLTHSHTPIGSGRPDLFCGFCRQNGEKKSYYHSHNLKDNWRVTCPVLWSYTCPNCGATGDHAHTVRYCPLTAMTGSAPVGKARKFGKSSSRQKRYQLFQ